jgi:hypothetical protein
MTKMSWTHYSKGAILGVLLAISLVAVGTAGAVSFDGESPAATNVNDTAEMNATIESPFNGPPEQWTLRATTELENASWSYEVYEQGSRIDSGATDTEELTLDLDSTGTTTPSRVVVRVSGDVPDDIQYNYEERSAENYTVLTLENANSGEELQSYDAHRYTDGSESAREAIDSAQTAIDETDDPPEDAQSQLDRAISSYDNGNFQNAQSLAGDAESSAEEEQSSGLPLPLIGGAAVLVLLVVGGGVYYYQNQQSENYKLQ